MECQIEYWKLKRILAATAMLDRSDVVLNFKKNGLLIRHTDQQKARLLHLEIPASVWRKYEPCPEPLKIPVFGKRGLYKRLTGGKSVNLVTLRANLKESNQLKIDLANPYGHRVMGFPIFDLEEGDEVPDLPDHFKLVEAKIKVFVEAMKNAVEDAKKIGVISCYLEARRNPDRFVVWSMEKGTFNSTWSEFYEGMSMMGMELDADKVRTSMGVELLRGALTAAAPLTDVVLLEFANDFPLKMTFQLPFEGRFEVMLAPYIQRE